MNNGLIPVTVREFSLDTEGYICEIIERMDCDTYDQGDYYFTISVGHLYCYKKTRYRNKLMWKVLLWYTDKDMNIKSPYVFNISSNTLKRIAETNGISIEQIKSVPFLHEK